MEKRAWIGLGCILAACFVWAALTSGPVPLRAQVDVSGTAGPIIVASSADLANLTINNGGVAILADTSTGGLLYYNSTSTATVDGVDVYNGPNSVGRFIRFGASAVPTSGVVTVSESTVPSAGVAAGFYAVRTGSGRGLYWSNGTSVTLLTLTSDDGTW